MNTEMDNEILRESNKTLAAEAKALTAEVEALRKLVQEAIPGMDRQAKIRKVSNGFDLALKDRARVWLDKAASLVGTNGGEKR